MSPDTTLKDTVTSLYPPADRERVHFRASLRTLADGKAVAIVADDAHGPDGLLATLRAMLSLRRIGRRRPPPTLLISDPPFTEGDEIRVAVDETHLENVYIQSGDVAVFERTDG